jgi:hypothetical protein
MWTVCFGALISATYIIRVPIQRALQNKVVATTNYVLWSFWGNEPEVGLSQTNVRMITNITQNQQVSVKEKQGKTTTRLCPEANKRNETRVSQAVEEGQETLFKLFDLSQ